MKKRYHLSPQSIKICVSKKDWDQGKKRKRMQGLRKDRAEKDDSWIPMDNESSSSYNGGIIGSVLDVNFQPRVQIK